MKKLIGLIGFLSVYANAADLNMDDLKSLSQQKMWGEILEKAASVEPSERTVDWNKIVTSAAIAEVQEVADQSTQEFAQADKAVHVISKAEPKYPFLLKNAEYIKAKSAALGKVADVCSKNSSYGCGALIELLSKGVSTYPKGTAFKIALLLGEETVPSQTMKFWSLAVKDDPANCEHGSVLRAVRGALKGPAGSGVTEAQNAARTCIASVEKDLMDALGKSEPGSDFAKNFCPIVKDRGGYNMVKKQKCK
ncbi:MAG: hypothetical protein AB7O96_10515 [Pseudobdellovibrionaceae bacterium]